MQIEMIGCQNTYTRLLLESDNLITPELLCEVAHSDRSPFHAQILNLKETYIEFSIDRHVAFFPIEGEYISFRAWQELHLQAYEGAEYHWHAAYLYRLTQRAPGIEKLTVYEMKPVQVGQPTYITFSNLIPPSREQFAQIVVHEEAAAAFPYDYLSGTEWIKWATE